ncbi:MAG: UDP-3-O-(3-hydroxymyristoyl)glucosamine N-acyltransferase [Proteobacteria bacterium]|nr:UDP-3-O-(3-hydroxymyristoyl)glucosamine N-acyltransferase [Pseudomonadota bacterium]
MIDARFFAAVVPHTAAELAAVAGADVAGDGDRVLTGVAPLHTAGPADLAFFDNPAYRDAFAASDAGAICARPEHAAIAPAGAVLLISAQPVRAYAVAAGALFPPAAQPAGISAAAHVDAAARLGPGCAVEAGAVIEAGAELGADCVIGANTVIRAGVSLGRSCWIDAGATISHAVIGERVRIGPGCRIGQAGFGFVPEPPEFLPVPQLGRVSIGDGAVLGANCTIDRGASGDTEIGAGCHIDNQVHLAHNVRLGRGCILAGQVGIAGSSVLGDYVRMGGQAGVAGHLNIGDGVNIAAGSGVIRDVSDGGTVGGYPAQPIRDWHRQTASVRRLARGGKDGNGEAG